MDIRKTNKGIIGCIIILCFVFFLLYHANNLLIRKDSAKKFDAFYAQEENFDVLFLGTSHINNGISPMDLWEKYGIVSYNLATPGCRMATSYWVLQNALKYTSPKLIVLDCAYLCDEKAHGEMEYNHCVFDSMPLDALKVEAIFDLYDEIDDQLSYIFPFSLYHERWNELDKGDFIDQCNYARMGFEPLDYVVTTNLSDFVALNPQPINNISIIYLEKIIEECQEKEIDILLTFFPFYEDEDSKNQAAYLYELAGKYDINYLAPDYLAQMINVKTDFANNDFNNSHLNVSGAHKMSYYLGDYIIRNYDIPDQRENSDYAFWHDYYDKYVEDKISLIKNQQMLDAYLMLSADKNFDVIVDIRNLCIWESEYYKNFLENIGIDLSKTTHQTDFLVIQEAGEKVYSIEKFHKNGMQIETSIGNFSIEVDETEELDNAYTIYMNNEVFYSVSAKESEDPDIQVILIDKNTMRIVDNAIFSYQFKRFN